jgi:UDP-N-acetylglucosamine 2-epimerase (non-hydrolysing)
VPLKLLFFFGTRPEAIKVAPVLQVLRTNHQLRPVVVVSGQHRRMLDQVITLFDISPDFDLDIIEERQTLTGITTRALQRLSPIIEAEEPAMVLVQGDTTTTFVGALAAFYHQVPVAHIEAGLRTGNRYSPYPEEINRRLTSQLTSLHLAPTRSAKENLVAEGIARNDIVVTGNTVIDALLWTRDRAPEYDEPSLADLDQHSGPVLLVTAHRRESWGEALIEVGQAIADVARLQPDLIVVLPVHRNPVVRESLLPELSGLQNVRVVEPMSYGGFVRLMARSSIILTDSGGIQEEGPSLGKPVLVMRETTERPEAVEAGTVRLVGTDRAVIRDAIVRLLRDASAYDAMARAINPYGDGHAARRVVAAIENYFGKGRAVQEWH